MAGRCTVTGLNFSRSAPQITALAASLRESYSATLDSIATSTDNTFASTFGRLARADDDVAARACEATLPALVAAEPERRAAGAAAKQALQDMFSDAYSRRDVFEALAAAAESSGNESEARIAERYLALWTRNGMALESESERAAVAAKSAAIATLSAEFEQAINEDVTSVSFDPSCDLVGVPDSYVASLERDPMDSAKVRVGCKASQMAPVMQNCTVEATRRALHLAASTRCAANLERLAQLVRLRAESAALLGYASHAERALAAKMAATPSATHAFLDGIANKVS